MRPIRRRYLLHRPTTRQRLSEPLLRGPRPASRWIWALFIIVCSVCTWLLFTQQNSLYVESLQQKVEEMEAKTPIQQPSESNLLLSMQEDPQDIVDRPRLMIWRIEGATLSDQGLRPCAPFGWRGERLRDTNLHTQQALVGLSWTPDTTESMRQPIMSQSVWLREQTLSVQTSLNPHVSLTGIELGKVLLRHHRLASCLIGARSELHDPWLSKSWGAERWKQSSLLETLDRWVDLSSEGAYHSTVGLARFGLLEQSIYHDTSDGRSLLRRLLRTWLLEEADGSSSWLKHWSLKPAHEIENWLGKSEVLVWESSKNYVPLTTQDLQKWTRVQEDQVRQLSRSLEKGSPLATSKSLADTQSEKTKIRSPKKAAKPRKEIKDKPRKIKTLKLNYD